MCACGGDAWSIWRYFWNGLHSFPQIFKEVFSFLTSATLHQITIDSRMSNFVWICWDFNLIVSNLLFSLFGKEYWLKWPKKLRRCNFGIAHGFLAVMHPLVGSLMYSANILRSALCQALCSRSAWNIRDESSNNAVKSSGQRGQMRKVSWVDKLKDR